MKTELSVVALFLCILAGLQACKTTQKSIQTDFYLTKDLMIDRDFQPVENDMNFYEIYEVAIKDSLLTLYVKYYTGDEIHNFDLVTTGLNVKTLPPVIPLYLKGSTQVGIARKLIFQELIFNLSPVRGWTDKQVILKIHGYPNVIIYRY